MGRVKRSKKIASRLHKLIKPTDGRIKEEQRVIRAKKVDPNELKITRAPKTSAAMFFNYNTQLGPPYHVIVDTNFIQFSVQNKLDIVKSMMDVMYAKCIPYITDCVMAELEKLGAKYRVALRLVKDPRFQRLHCQHKGTYADDCINQRVVQNKCYIVATCDKDLKRRIRKIGGVPIMCIWRHRYTVDGMPDAFGAPR